MNAYEELEKPSHPEIAADEASPGKKPKLPCRLLHPEIAADEASPGKKPKLPCRLLHPEIAADEASQGLYDPAESFLLPHSSTHELLATAP
jgi:hypothetical protein